MLYLFDYHNLNIPNKRWMYAYLCLDASLQVGRSPISLDKPLWMVERRRRKFCFRLHFLVVIPPEPRRCLPLPPPPPACPMLPLSTVW